MIENKIHNKQEQGRSMTEMLGVLAIIGVLSIGGIAGYTYAMERHYTNEILNAASQRAVVIASQIAAGRQASLTEFDGQKEVAGGTFDGTVEKWDDEFGIQVNGVNKAVCENLVKMATESNVISAIAKAGTPDTAITESDCVDSNNLLMIYHENMGNESDKTKTCESGIIKVYNCETKTTTDCCPDTEDCTQPTDCSCSDETDCPGQQECYEGICKCPSGSLGGVGPTDDGVLGSDGLTCCAGYLTYVGNNQYSGTNPQVCGCPDGATVRGEACCDDYNWAWTGTSYNALWAGACGCPDGGYFGNDGTTCCLDGYSLNGIIDATYSNFNPIICGCPYGGSIEEGNICCKNGGAWNSSRRSYTTMNINACGGCPEGGTESEKTPGICCKDGNAWASVDGYSDVYAYVEFHSACNDGGCPEDAMEGKNFATTGVCCSTSGGFEYLSGSLNIAECGCPYFMGDVSEIDPNVCCSNGAAYVPEMYGYYGVNIEACQGCPTSPISGNQGTISSDRLTCCYGGKAWSDEEPDYTKISSSCS